MSRPNKKVIFVMAWAARSAGEVMSLEGDLADSLFRAGVVRFVAEPESAAMPVPSQAAVAGPTEAAVAGPTVQPEGSRAAVPDPAALDGLDMSELRELAFSLGVAPKRSKADTIAAILEAAA